jgi:hypothetical protein
VQKRGAELVLAGVAVLLYEPDELERSQDPVDGSLGEAQLTGQLGHAEAARTTGEQAQNRGCALDGLDSARHLIGCSRTRADWRTGRSNDV